MRELDGSRSVQIREDRLTISHVARYERWEDLVDDAAANFHSFIAAGKPMRVTRVAARFVNRIPMHLGTFGDLLAIPPQLLPELADARVTDFVRRHVIRSEEHTSELQSLMRISYAVFCLKKNKKELILNTTRKDEHT